MNQLGFLPLILLYAWPVSIIKKIWVSHLWKKFSRFETPQNIPYEHDDVRSVKRLRSPRCSQAQTYEQRKEHACWKVQVNVDSTYRGRLLLLIEGGGDEKNMECPMLFSAPQPPPLPPPLSPLFISFGRRWQVKIISHITNSNVTITDSS